MTTPTPTIRAALERLVAAVKPKYTDPEEIVEAASAVLAARAALKAEPETPAEALAARPLLEQVAAMAGCISAQTVGQITAISARAAAWLRQNPPGQPRAIEPRGCPTPGGCSCVEPAPPPPEPGEVAELVELLKLAGRWATSTGVHLDRVAALFDHQEAELAALRGVAVGEPLPTHDLSNAAPLLWLLWHHQGNHSPIGQHIRKYLGMGQFEPMSDAQIGAASFYQALGAETGSESSLSGFSDGEMLLG